MTFEVRIVLSLAMRVEGNPARCFVCAHGFGRRGGGDGGFVGSVMVGERRERERERERVKRGGGRELMKSKNWHRIKFRRQKTA